MRIALRFRLAAVGMGAVLALASTSCKGVLGLDAPELDTCPDGCEDGGIGAPDAPDGASGDLDATPPDAHDAAIDQGPVKGLPCGAVGAGLIGCEGTTPVCCQITTGGTTTYACRKSTSACEDYPIRAPATTTARGAAFAVRPNRASSAPANRAATTRR